MDFCKLTNLDLIKMLESSTELFRNKIYFDKKHVESFIGLTVHRSGFYGRKIGNDIQPLHRNTTTFDSNEDITIVVEGYVNLEKVPENVGTGSISFEGYGNLEINCQPYYSGGVPTDIDTDDVANVSSVPGPSTTIALNNLASDINDINTKTFKVTYYESIDISTGTSGTLSQTPSSATILTGDEFGASGEAVLSTTVAGGKPSYESPRNGVTPITVALDGNGNWVSSDTFSGDVVIIYKFLIQLGNWNEIVPENVLDYYRDDLDTDEVINLSNLPGSNVTEALNSISYVLEEQSFDVTTDSLPITANSDTTKLKVNFINFDKDLDLTNQLPTNLNPGARVVVRKMDSSIYSLSYNDGDIEYDYIKRKGEYLSLEWTGTKYII